MIKDLKSILTTLKDVQITTCSIDPQDEGSLIRGSNKDGGLAVFDTYPNPICDVAMGIQSVDGLLSRIDLFDIEKASVDLDETSSHVRSITIKEGKKKASYRFQTSSRLSIPNKNP